MDANPVYENHQLDPSTTSIRLLELLDTGTEAIACRFHIKALDQSPPYFALSYTWGDEVEEFNIDIGGHGFLVRKNLRDFLSQARDRRKWYRTVASPERQHLLWIDAVCINQKNVEERNRQVRLMGEIYKKAAFVSVWLGTSSNDSDCAMDCLSRTRYFCARSFEFAKRTRQILPDDLLDSVEQGKNTYTEPLSSSIPWSTAELEAIKALCERPYWHRVWIIQEFVLAKRILLLCGTKSARLQVMNDLLSGLTANEGQEAATYRKIHDSTALKILESKLWWRKDSREERPGLPLPNLLVAFAYADATNARDKVYSLLSLTDEKWKVTVNYGKPVLDVYKDVLNSLVVAEDKTFVKSDADRYAFCQVLQDSLGLDHADIGVRLATMSFAPLFYDSKDMPTWYHRLRDSKTDMKFASLLQNYDDLQDDVVVEDQDMKRAKEFWDPLAAMSKKA